MSKPRKPLHGLVTELHCLQDILDNGSDIVKYLETDSSGMKGGASPFTLSLPPAR
jgi:hypothetical protein